MTHYENTIFKILTTITKIEKEIETNNHKIKEIPTEKIAEKILIPLRNILQTIYNIKYL